MTSWYDVARIALYAGGLILAALAVRAVQVGRMWQPGRRRELAGLLAVAVLIVQAVWRRPGAIGTGPFKDGPNVYLTAAAMVLAIVWLSGRIRYVPPWRRTARR